MKIIYSIIVLLLASNLSFAQTVVTITADRDNTMYSENANSNGIGDYIFAGSTFSGAKRRALVRFDLSSIPTNAVITDITLTLTCNKTAASAAGVKIHKVTNDWGEGNSNANGQEGSGAAPTTNDATWSNRFHPGTAWGTAGGDFVATVTDSKSSVSVGAVAFTGTTGSNLVADVQSFVATPATNFGWIFIGTAEGSISTALRFASREFGVPANRPSLRVTYTANLPINLSAFSATLLKGNGLLKWQTLTEVNNKYFDLEHSRDGKTFVPIGRVDGNGTSAVKHDYSFTHNNIPAGKNYYRLSQYDVNGARQFSPIVLLTGSKTPAMDVFPNPTRNYLQINAPFILQKVEYNIINNSGQVMQRGVMNSQQIQIQNLPAGQYYLSVQSPEGEWYRRSFIKK
jgi:hypothetical protein